MRTTSRAAGRSPRRAAGRTVPTGFPVAPPTGWRARSVGDGTFDRPPPSDSIAAGVLGVALIGELLAAELQGGTEALVPVAVGTLLAVVIASPLAWRRVTPVRTIAISGTATGAFTLLGFSLGLAGLTLVLALYSVAAYGTREDAWVSLAITAGFVVLGFGSDWWRTGAPEVMGFVVTSLVLTGVFALGDRTRARRQLVAQLEVRAEEAERHQHLATALAAADERRRIARELHDVVAHTVSVVVVQASAGRRVAERDPEAAAAVLADIESSGRAALAELRRLVTVLRDDGPADGRAGPQPTLEDVPGLVARLSDAGVPVRLEEDLLPAAEVPTGVAVSAYRIVQESLTNVLKHAGPVSEVVVTLQQRAGMLQVAVADDGRGGTPPQAPPDPDVAGTVTAAMATGDATDRTGSGTGLLGMRERAALLGGALTAGHRPEGGFRVAAELPLPHPDGEPDRIGVPEVPTGAARRHTAGGARQRQDPR